MRVSMQWIRDWVDLPAEVSGREVADRLIAAGLEVEAVEVMGAGVIGDLTVGQVIQIEELTEFNKPIRWCQVDLGPAAGGVRGIICGASNFNVDDLVVVAVPGTVLPGDFAIAARKTYGHVSDGMICSERELALGEDHAGIIVLTDAKVGGDAKRILGIGDEVLDIAITPDRGYALSVRGVAREVAIAFDLDFVDRAMELADLPAPSDDAAPWPCGVDDPLISQLFTLRRIIGFNPQAATPAWIRRRLVSAGMRPVSLAVDVTNYVMLEMGQPLHAFDGAKLQGPVRASRAGADAKFTTLDHVERVLTPDDIVIRDDSGPIGIAGIMGGLTSEISETTTDVVLEAAWFVPHTVAQVARRLRLSSEASRRFERGVDRVLAPYVSARAAQLLLHYGGGTYVGFTAWEAPYEPTVIAMDAALPGRVGGLDIDVDTVVDRLTSVGCEVAPQSATAGGEVLMVTAPAWRLDLVDPADLVEEVLRLGGYDALPSVLPGVALGRGLTPAQRLRRRVGIALAGAGVTDVLTYPFIGNDDLDGLLIEPTDERRRTVSLANPLNDDQPYLRTTLLPGLLTALRRNVSRGFDDVALSEIGRLFLARDNVDAPTSVVRPAITHRPSAEELAGLEQLLPWQPFSVAAVFSGDRRRSGWWGPGQPYTWADAVEVANTIARELGLVFTGSKAEQAPWHPGRVAALSLGDTVVGYAGELDPRVLTTLGLPKRVCAFELDLSLLSDRAVALAAAPVFHSAPVAKEDLALVVADDMPSSRVAAAIAAGGGDLVESVRLFDVYQGPQVPAGKKSLAFAVRLRAPERTLTSAEIAQVRADAIAAASDHCDAVLR